MLEFALIAAYVAVLFFTAIKAFLEPRGVYWRSAAGLGLAIAFATLLWWAGSPLVSSAAGFGAFAIWIAVLVLAAIIAVTACAAATLRHMLNAFGARLIA